MEGIVDYKWNSEECSKEGYWDTGVQAGDRCQSRGSLGQEKELTKMKYAWRSSLGTSDTATQVKIRIRWDGRTKVIWNNMDNILGAKGLGWEQGLGEGTGKNTHQKRSRGNEALWTSIIFFL